MKIDHLAADKHALEQRTKVLPSTYRLFYERPVIVDHAKGAWLWERDGSRLLDAYNNVPVVGHSNSEVAAQVGAALQRINTHTRYVEPSIAKYAEKLLDDFPPSMDRVIFTSSGSEANDLALQVARVLTGRRGVVVTSNAYHGTTAALAALSPSLSTHWKDEQSIFVDVPSGLAGTAEFGPALAERVAAAITELESRGVGFAALLFDSVLSSDGIFTDPVGFLQPVRDVVSRAGGLYIADEVQSGFCRTGTAMWGFERHGIVPDLAVLGKPMGNGLPIAALVGGHTLLDTYGDSFRYFNTFGGNTACVAAASAVLQIIHRDRLGERSERIGTRIRRALNDEVARLKLPFRVRGSGMLIGVDTSPIADFPGPPSVGALAHHLMNDLREHGVLVGTTGVENNVLKIRPPLVLNDRQASLLIEQISGAFGRLCTNGDDTNVH
ncbi:aspartate aminotransferase family protein [Salinibacterium sp. ZJ450]|uniref:aspartate aminotransferase family protein n=1 Tax=Salinibacterium sp. ZJ450 TaxID=2708338 RepID=UPI00142328F7|nr:aminotransferase class III-fold pyridoxal phosphate-dependent enzyme [Salinibacterium sp. ZJ450]